MNILITAGPTTGKTVFARNIDNSMGYTVIDTDDIVKTRHREMWRNPASRASLEATGDPWGQDVACDTFSHVCERVLAINKLEKRAVVVLSNIISMYTSVRGVKLLSSAADLFPSRNVVMRADGDEVFELALARARAGGGRFGTETLEQTSRRVATDVLFLHAAFERAATDGVVQPYRLTIGRFLSDTMYLK